MRIARVADDVSGNGFWSFGVSVQGKYWHVWPSEQPRQRALCGYVPRHPVPLVEEPDLERFPICPRCRRWWEMMLADGYPERKEEAENERAD